MKSTSARSPFESAARIVAAIPTVFVYLAAAVLSTAGCYDASQPKFGGSSGTPEAEAAAPNDAERLLERVIAAYQSADSYADRGELTIRFRRDGRPFESTIAFSTVLQRPNKLQMHYYQAHVVCDGKSLWGWTDDMPGYLLRRSQSTALSLGDLYADDVLRSMLSEGQAGGSLQLAMLLGVETRDLIRAGGERPELLNDDLLDGRPYRRVRVRREDGNLIYWIDRETFCLRRIEYPTRRLALTMAQPTPPSEVSLTAEFYDPRLNPRIDPQAFQFDPPANVKIVEKLDPFVAVPPPPPLAQTLGAKVGDCRMVGLDGRKIAPTDWAGKAAVVLFWSLGNNESKDALEKLNAAYVACRSRSDVVFLAVSIDPAGPGGVTDAELREVLTTRKIEIAAARDEQQSSLAAFDVRFVPNLYVVGRNGVIEDNEIGLNPQLAEDLPKRLDRLAQGESLTADARKRFDERLKRYEQSQAAAAGNDAASALPKTSIAPAAEPQKLKLTRLWHAGEIAKPGFLLLTDGKEGKPRLIVADGLRGVVELDENGKIVDRPKLDLPTAPVEAVVSFWRTAIDKQGRRVFVGSAGAQQQLHVFDAHFKRLLSYPDGTHAGISDVQLGDLDNDGEPELLVGYWGVVGLQSVGLDGTRRWANRRLPENVLRLAVSRLDSRGKRLLLATTGVLTVAVIDDAGETLKEMPVGSRAVRLVAVDDLTGDGSIELCGIATTGPGTDVAVGFNAAGDELWNYPLPPGVQPVPELQNEIVVAGKLLADEPGYWIFAGADGTVHFVGHDGTLRDRFAWGKPLHGLAVGEFGGAPTLLLSDADGVSALRFTK